MKKDILTYINQARYIAYMCNTRAEDLTKQAEGIKASRNTRIWLKQQAQKDLLKLRAAILRDRATKVWYAVTGYQGKYINYRDVHVIDGIQYTGIIALIDASFTHKSYDKYAIA